MKKVIPIILVFVLCLFLCACGKADNYESAIAMMTAGNYEGAIVAFTELGNYKESAQKLEECKNIKAYIEATALFEAEKFDEALSIFSTLSNYKDSADKAKECENVLAYENALNLLNDGEYEQAYDALLAIKDYKDVADLLTHFIEVEITPENWNNYFTVIEEAEYSKNDFGEITDIDLRHYLSLSTETNDKIFNPTDSNVIFELSFDKTPKDIQFGSAEDGYVITDSEYFKVLKDWKTTTLTWNCSASPKNQISQPERVEEAVAPGETAPFAYLVPENFEAIRAQGSISMNKQEQGASHGSLFLFALQKVNILINRCSAQTAQPGKLDCLAYRLVCGLS